MLHNVKDSSTPSSSFQLNENYILHLLNVTYFIISETLLQKLETEQVTK